MSGRSSILLATLLVGLAPSFATAQNAEEHMDAGLEARRQQRDAEAAEHFRAAYEVDRSPRALAQLALAEQALGRWIAAEASLVQALTHDDEWIVRHRDVLNGALATIRTHLGDLMVESSRAGAQLFMDGRAVGTLPLAAPLRAEVGTAVIELRAEGYVPVQRRTEISAGALARLHIDLVEVAREPSPPEPSVTPEPLALASPTEPPPEPTLVPVPDPDPSLLLYAGIGTAVATAATLVVTLVAVGVREDQVQVWNDGARCPADPVLGRLAACADVYSTWRTAEDWAIAGAVTAGILAAASATLLGLAAVDAGGAEVAFHLGPQRLGATARIPF